MMDRNKKIRICTVLLVLNLCFIWGNSLLPGEISGAFSDWVKNLLASLFQPGEEDPASGGLLRKLAHFTEFASLGLLLSCLYALHGRKCRMAFLWGVLAACLDETIQIFVPDRGPGLRDVAIDSIGVLTGMFLMQIGYLVRKRNQSKSYGGKQ